MFYYRYNDEYYIIEKSDTKLEGDNIAQCEEDFDLNLYSVRIGYLGDGDVILKNTKKLRPAEQIETYMKEIRNRVSELEQIVSLLNDTMLEQLGL